VTGLGAADRGDATPPRGRRITIADRTLTVVGVARNGRYDYRVIDDPLEPVVYYSIAQTPGRYAALHVCTQKAAFAFAPAIHRGRAQGLQPIQGTFAGRIAHFRSRALMSTYAASMSWARAAESTSRPGQSFTWRPRLPVPSSRRAGSFSNAPKKKPTLT
jgi:hypothetical protein